MNCSNTFEYLLILISLVSLSCGVCVQKSCPLGTFCPIDTSCSGDTSLCVTECNLEISQGNWSSGNCELVPEEYNYWLDATFYEVLISSQLNAGTAILNITFSVARLLQSDDEDDILFSGSGSGSGSGLGSGILSEVTFNLETDHSFFKLKNGDTSHAVLSNKVNVASLAETGTIVTASSNPIPLGDYEMQVSVTRDNNVLRSSGVVIHVVETLPSILPAQTTCVEFEFSEYTVTESAGMLRVTLLLLGREQLVSFNVTVIANNTGSSSAIAGEDFTPGRYNATFTPGATKATTVIPIMIDNLPEDTEQFDLRLYIDGAGYELGLQNGNIRNAKAFIIQPNITGIVVEFKENVYSVVEDVGIYNVTVVKQGNSLQDIVVNIIPAPETAKFRFDYSLASFGSITFTPDGPNERTVQLSVDADQLLELNETYLLRLDLPAASITAGVQIGTIYQARVTIINDDRIQVFFKQKFVETKELEDVIVIHVGFSPQKTTIPFTVRVETFDLTPPVAQAGIDYQPLIQNITFSQSAASVPIEIKIIENNITDGNRIFGLRLVIPEESKQLGIQLGTPSESNITIVDDDVGDLELACYTATNGDVISGHSITLHCKANQIVAYSCSVNNQSFQPCFNPYVIRAVDTRNPVNIGVNAIAPGVAPVSLTLTALTATAEVQIVGNGAIAIYIQSSKNATFRCRLNDGQLRTCVDGQMFDGLIAGTYTVTVDARGIENMRDVASYTVGPVVIVAGVNATVNEDIASCFGSWKANCSNNSQNCEYAAYWSTKADQVEFRVMAKTQGWLSIGFSIDNKMPHSDIIVGATNGTISLLEDRYADQRSSVEKDAMQNIDNVSITIIDGVTIMSFVRDKITNDSDGDLNLNVCRFILFAWGNDIDFNSGIIRYQGFSASSELICFPSSAVCPKKFDCGDPGAPVNGARNFSSTLEDSIVSYSCNAGYKLIGNKTRVCRVTAEEGALWKFDIPKCQFLTIAFARSEFNGSEESGSIDVEVILSEQLPSNASITIEVVATEQMPESATGSGVDFVSDPINITFGPGESKKSLSIPVICDNFIEGTETFKASFSVQYHDVPIETGLNNATISIIDSTAEVMFNQSTYVINEDTQLFMFAIKLSQASKVPVGITINVINATTIGESFIQKIINETIDAGIIEQSFPLQLARNNNSIIECTKTLSLILSTQEICKTVTENNSIAEIDILNDDVGAVSLQIPDAVNESIGSILINVSLNATTSEDVVLNFTISDISTTAGSDYSQTEISVPSMSSLTIGRGELSGSLSIEIIDDAVKEQNETFLITVLILDSCLPLVFDENDTFAITIIDNEELAVEFSQVLFSGFESSGGIVVMLNLLGGTASYAFNVTVTLSSSSASDGLDYDNSPLIATFNAGDTSATVVIPITNDNIEEENEVLNLTVVISPLTGIKLGTLVNANAIILDATLPRIITHPMDRTVEVNNDTTNTHLHCMASGAVSFEWEKQNGVIPSDAEGVNSSTVTLIGITPTDGGRYRCIAINEHGRNYSDYATLIVTAHSPVVSVTPSSITATEGDSVTFTCIATGVGASDFTYEWLINGNLMQGINELNYTITVSESTVGNYTCIVKNQFGGSSQSNTAILNLKLPFCNSVTVTYSGFSITWNETQVGDTVEALCTGVGLTGTVRRSCIRRDIWEEFVECIREEINVLMEEASDLISDLDKITDMEIISTVDDIVVELANLTLPEQAQMHLTSEFVVVVDVLSLLNNVTETVINTLQPNDTFFERTVQVLDNLLSTINENSWQQLEQMSPSTSQKFIANIERFGRLLGETLNREVMEFIEARENIVIKAEIVTEESISSAQRPYMFPDNDDNMDSFTGRSGQVLLPNMLLKEVLDKLPEDSTQFVITNFVLRDGSLPLPNPPNGSATKEPVTSIISSQLPIPIDNTMHPIALIFDVPPTTLDERKDGVTSHLQHTCEFYDHTLSFNGNQTGAWSTVGIKLDKSRSNKTTVTCLSTHLTSFAVLVGNQNETQPPLVDDKQTLSVFIYIGSAICLGCLIISIIILGLALYNNKGKAKLIFVHLNLCIALALGLVVLIAGIENATDDRVSCVVVAALLQYFFTSALCWMFSEGVMFYMMLVTVFSNKLNRLWFFFALGWGPAIPIVAISLGITHEQYGTDDHCWIESGKGALAAFILPILIVIVITCAFLMISLRLLYANQRKSNSEKRNSTRNTVKALLIITIIFLPLLGITWIFGILAVNEESAVFAWIFAILNAILGTLIFVFHVASDDQVGFNKKIKACYKSETFFTFYSGIRYYTVSRNGNNGKSRSATGIDKTSDHTHQVEMSTSVDSIEDQSTTTTTFKPPELPLEDREVKKDPIILMAINPLEETALSEDGNTVALRQEIAVKEETTSVPTNEH